LSVFRASTEVYYGVDRYSELRARLDGRYPRIVVCVDSSLVESESKGEIVNFLMSIAEVSEHYISVRGEPTYESLSQAFLSFAELGSPDLIVGIGGGSTLDMVKGLALLSKNPAAAEDPTMLRGMHKVKIPGVPVLLIPSTCGTGSEVTWTASFIDEEGLVKLGINGDFVFAKYALLEPRLILGAPNPVIISSALDALVHASEAISSQMRNAFAVTLAQSAIRRIFQNFEKLLHSDDVGTRLESAEHMLLASTEAGLAMLNSSGGLASALSYPLGARLGVPHGLAGGVPLKFTELLYERLGYDTMYGFLGEGKVYSAEISRLYKAVGAPSSLANWKLRDYGLEQLVEATFEEKRGSLELCPVEVSREAALSVLESIS